MTAEDEIAARVAAAPRNPDRDTEPCATCDGRGCPDCALVPAARAVLDQVSAALTGGTLTPDDVLDLGDVVSEYGAIRAGGKTPRRLLRQAEARLAEARDDLRRFEAWSNEIAVHVPERYEASEGTQEGCISDWLGDVLADLDRFRTALQRIDTEGAPHADEILNQKANALWATAHEALAAEASGEIDPQTRDDD